MSQDPLPAALTVPQMTRWDPAQLERAQAAADALGLPRSVIIRAAFDHGIAVVEGSVKALVGAAPETGEPA
jgi:hypothetical protein